MSAKPTHIFLFDMTRHRSHLFFRYLGTHPEVQDLWHPFLSAFLFGPERITQHTQNQGRGEWTTYRDDESYHNAINKLSQAVEEANSKGKTLVANEHCQIILQQKLVLGLVRGEQVDFPPNPTHIPDPLWETLTPIFVIRKPVFSLPSNYVIFLETGSHIRPGDEDWKMCTNLLSQRRLFDHIRARDGKTPLVVDGDDTIWRTTEIGDKLSKALHISPDGLSGMWQATPEENRHEHPVIRQFLQTIDDSTGIQTPSTQRPDPDLDKAYVKWVDKYGEDIAKELRATAVENMPHYEYMAQFKI